jgi:hypothetical protein
MTGLGMIDRLSGGDSRRPTTASQYKTAVAGAHIVLTLLPWDGHGSGKGMRWMILSRQSKSKVYLMIDSIITVP